MSPKTSSLTLLELPEPIPFEPSAAVWQRRFPIANAGRRVGFAATLPAAVALGTKALSSVVRVAKWEPVSIVCTWPAGNAPPAESERARKRRAAFERFCELRREAEEAGMKLLTREEILAEVRDRRGGMEAVD